MRYSTSSPSSSSSVTHAPKNTRDAIRRRLVDHDHAVETLSQEADTAVDFAQLPLAVDVFGVLRAVALRGGLLHRLRHLRAQHAPQVIQLAASAALHPAGVMNLEPRGCGGRYRDM